MLHIRIFWYIPYNIAVIIVVAMVVVVVVVMVEIEVVVVVTVVGGVPGAAPAHRASPTLSAA